MIRRRGQTPPEGLLLERLEKRILLNAVPDVSIEAPDEALIGENVEFEVTFDLPATATDVGYGPFVDLILPRDGADGAQGTDTPDGIGTDPNAVGFSFLGTPLTPALDTVVDASGTVQHPLLRNPDGSPVIVTGLTPGDRFIVLQLPLGSYEPDTSPLLISGRANVDAFADAGTALPIQARGGFQFGVDPLDNPSTDDPSQTLSGFVTDQVTPEVIRIDKIVNAPEGETATGRNFPRSYTLQVDVASGQTVTDVKLNDPLSNRLVYLGNVVEGGSSPDAGNGTLTNQPPIDTGPLNGSEFTIEYAQVRGVAGGSDLAVSFDFYVPENDADGNPILDPASGDDSTTQNSANATYTWQPLDPRDQEVTETVTDPLDGDDQTLTNKSIAVQKEVGIAIDNGPAGASPGDVLEYRINFQISDYFDFQALVLNDLLSDGQSFDTSFAPLLEIAGNGSSPVPQAAFDPANFDFSVQAAAPFGTEVTFRVSDELITRGQTGVLLGNQNNAPGTTGTIVFRAEINDTFRDPSLPLESRPVDEGDRVGNNVTIAGTIVGSGQSETDTSSASTTLPTGDLDKDILAINGDPVIGTPAAGPGETVTYRLLFDLPLSRFENLILSDSLPLPIFDAGSLTTFNNTLLASGVPAVGEVAYGPSAQAFFDLYAVDAGRAPTLITSTTSNSFAIDFGTFTAATPQATTIELLYTVEFEDVPFADGLFLGNLVESTQITTNSGTITDLELAQLLTQTPEPILKKGVVSTDAPQPPADFDPSPQAPVAFAQPGTSGPPFSGTITSSDLANTPIDSNLDNVDAGDLVKFAVVIENTGSEDAFDLIINETRPPGFVVPTGPQGLNLQVTAGDGSPLDFTDAAGNPLNPADIPTAFFTSGIRLVDPADLPAGDPLDGALDGTLEGLATGSNLIVVTFDLQAADSIRSDSQQIDVAELLSFGAINNGRDWTAGVNGPFVDDAIVTTTAPQVTKSLISTEIVNANNSNDEAVIGELATYEITVTVPEGFTDELRLVDDFGRLADMAFVSFDAITVSPGLLTDLGGGFAAVQPVVTNNGQTVTFDLGTVENQDRDNGSPETISVIVTGVVLNDVQNQSGSNAVNRAEVVYEVAGQDRVVTANSDRVQVIEPDLDVTKTATVNGMTAPPNGGDAGDIVEYTIRIAHSGASDTDAFELRLTDPLPSELINLSITAVSDTAGQLSVGDLAIVGNSLQFALQGNPAADQIDLPLGREIEIVVRGEIDINITPNQVVANQVEVDWTSLDGDPGQRSAFNPNSLERTGADGVGGPLNDYADRDVNRFNITREGLTKSIVATSESHTSFSRGREEVAIGEIVRYRLVASIPEATYNSAYLLDRLPNGLTFLDDGTTQVAFVGDDPTAFTATGFPQGDYPASIFVVGDENSVDSVTPTYVLGDLQISATPGDPNDDNFRPGRDPYFFFGDVVNQENDANLEFVVLEFNALVSNIGGNQAGTIRANQFTALYEQQENQTFSNRARVRVVEPDLSVEKTLTNSPADAGDEVTYSITLQNSNSANATTAFDLRLRDLLDPNLDLIAVNPVSIPPGTNLTDNSDTGAGNFVDLQIDRLETGGSIEIVVTARIDDSALAHLTIPNTVDVTYTSLPGARGTSSNPTGSSLPPAPAGEPGTIFGERTGSQIGPNDYFESSNVELTLASPLIEKSVTPNEYTIGEIIPFDLVVTLPEGITPSLQIVDNLPVGLEFVSFQVITDAASSNGLLQTDFAGSFGTPIPNTPTGSGADFELDFGDVTTTADNDVENNAFAIQVEARVLNVAGNQDGTVLTNAGEGRFTTPDGFTKALVPDSVDVTVREPEVTVDKQILGVSQSPPDAGDVIRYAVTLAHDPTSNRDAFEVTFEDLAPLNTLITNIVSVTGNGFGSGSLPVAEILGGGTRLQLSDVSNSGEFDLPLGASVTVTYEVTLQDSVRPGSSLVNVARIDWSSLDGDVNSGQARGERDGSSFPNPNGLNDYFDRDATRVATAAPDLAKVLVSSTIPETTGNSLAIGEEATFLVTITLPEGTYPDPFVVTDQLPLAPGKLEFVSAVFRSDLSDSDLQFTDVTLTTQDTNGDLLLDEASFTFTGLVNPSQVGTNDNQLVFEVTAVVPDESSNTRGDQLTNTATLTYPQFVDTGTADVVLVEPELGIDKSANVSTGDAGDIVTYSVVVNHTSASNAPAFDITINDSLLEGLGLDDKLDLVVGSVTSDRGSITSGNQPGDSAVGVSLDRLLVGETVTINFQARLNDNLNPIQDEVINTATVDFDSKPGLGGRMDNDQDTHRVTTDQQPVAIDKRVLRTSEPGTGDSEFDPTITDLAIGEVVTYEVTVVLPTGLYESPVRLTDQLPEFLALLSGSGDVRVARVGSDVQLDNVLVTTSDSGSDTFDDRVSIELSVDQVTLPPAGATSDNVVVFEIDAQVLNAAGNQASGNALTNVAEVIFGQSTDRATADIEIVEPDLLLDKSLINPAQGRLDAGDTLIYRVTLEHSSSSTSTAFGTTFTDVAPADTLITGVNLQVAGFATPPTAEIIGGGTGIRINGVSPGLFDLPLGASLTLEYTLTLQDSVQHNQTLVNDAAVDWTSLSTSGPTGSTGERTGEGSPNPNDVDNYFRNASVTTQAEGFLTLSKTALNGTAFAIGDTVEYELEVGLFEGTTPQLVINDQVPDLFKVDPASVRVVAGNNVTFNSPPVVTFTQGVLTVELGDVVNVGDNDPTNDRFRIEYDAVVVNDPANNNNDVKPNTATVTSSNQLTDNADTAVQIVEPLLSIDKSINDETPKLGDIVTYRFEIEHTAASTTDAYDLLVQDTLPSEVALDLSTLSIAAPSGTIVTDYSSGNTIDVALGRLNLGDRIVVTVEAKVTEELTAYGTTFENTVTLDWDSQPGDNPQQRPDNTLDNQPATIVGPDLVIDKSTNATVLFPGQEYDYQLQVTNKVSPVAEVATNALVVDRLPRGVEFVESTSPFFQGFDPGTGTVRWLIPTLDIGQSIDLSLRVRLAAPAPPTEIIINPAEVSHDDIDPTPQDNRDRVETPIDETVTPDLVITKDDGIVQAFPGDTITYAIRVVNVGDQTAQGILVNDIFPTDVLDFVSASDGGVFDASTGLVTWQFAELAGRGGEISLTLTGQVKSIVDDPLTMQFTNLVSVTDDGTLGPDPTPENNVDDDIDKVIFYAFDAFNDFVDDPAGFPQRTIQPALVPQGLVLSGIADPGTTLYLELRDSTGDLVGWQTTVTDAGGNYLANFPDVARGEQPLRTTAWPTSSALSVWGENGFNLRRYYEPAGDMASFFASTPADPTVLNNQASAILRAMQAADERPLALLPLDELAGYEERAASGLPGGR